MWTHSGLYPLIGIMYAYMHAYRCNIMPMIVIDGRRDDDGGALFCEQGRCVRVSPAEAGARILGAEARTLGIQRAAHQDVPKGRSRAMATCLSH